MTTRLTTCWMICLGIFLAIEKGHGADSLSYNPTDFEQVLAKAKAGDLSAILLLAQSYSSFRGSRLQVRIDSEEAYRWYTKAADLGHTESQYKVAKWLLGRLVFVDKNKRKALALEALDYFNKAAKQGYAEAYAPLGEFYAKGEYVTQNLMTAYMWYHLAAERSKSPSGASRARNELSKKLTEAQKIRAKIDADLHLNLVRMRK